MSSICHCQVCTRGLNTSCTCLSLPSKLWFILPRCFFPSFMCRLLLSARKSQDKRSPLFPFFPLFCLHFYLYDSVFDTWALSSCVRKDENNFSPSLSVAGFDRFLLNRCGMWACGSRILVQQL